MGYETLTPFDWWWSGRFWYCCLQFNGFKVSGAGITKPQAVADARKELGKRYSRSTSSHTA
jgi:hypothetical protein